MSNCSYGCGDSCGFGSLLCQGESAINKYNDYYSTGNGLYDGTGYGYGSSTGYGYIDDVGDGQPHAGGDFIIGTDIIEGLLLLDKKLSTCFDYPKDLP